MSISRSHGAIKSLGWQKKALKGYIRCLYETTEGKDGISREDKSTTNIIDDRMTQRDGEAYLRTFCVVYARVGICNIRMRNLCVFPPQDLEPVDLFYRRTHQSLHAEYGVTSFRQ